MQRLQLCFHCRSRSAGPKPVVLALVLALAVFVLVLLHLLVLDDSGGGGGGSDNLQRVLRAGSFIRKRRRRSFLADTPFRIAVVIPGGCAPGRAAFVFVVVVGAAVKDLAVDDEREDALVEGVRRLVFRGAGWVHRCAFRGLRW